MVRRRKGSVGGAASLVSPGPLARPCPAGRHARVGRLFQERFRSEEQPDAKPPKPSHAKTRPLAAGLSKPLFLSAFASRRKPAAVVHWDSRSHAFFSRAPPMKHDQFTLPFLDTTIVAEGFGLYGGFPTAKSSAQGQINVEPEEAELLDAPVPTKPSLPAQDDRLAGERCLAEGWKARAEDNLAALRLTAAIEAEGRHARPDEQERLAKFTAFGAVD